MKLKTLRNKYDTDKIAFNSKFLVLKKNLTIHISNKGENSLQFKLLNLEAHNSEHIVAENLLPINFSLTNSNRTKIFNYSRWEAKI